jgi:hypothetical protein
MKVPFISLSDAEEANSPKALRARRESMSQVFEPKPPATSPRSPRSRANVNDAMKDANHLFPPNYYYIQSKQVIIREPYLVSRFEIQNRYSLDEKIVKLRPCSEQQMKEFLTRSSFALDGESRDERVFCIIGEDTVVDYSDALNEMQVWFLVIENSTYENGAEQPVTHEESIVLTPVEKAIMCLHDNDHHLTKWMSQLDKKPSIPSFVYRSFDMTDKQGIPLIHLYTSAFLNSDYLKKNSDDTVHVMKLHDVIQEHVQILDRCCTAFHQLALSDDKYTHDRTFILEFKNSLEIISNLVAQINFQ